MKTRYKFQIIAKYFHSYDEVQQIFDDLCWRVPNFRHRFDLLLCKSLNRSRRCRRFAEARRRGPIFEGGSLVRRKVATPRLVNLLRRGLVSSLSLLSSTGWRWGLHSDMNTRTEFIIVKILACLLMGMETLTISKILINRHLKVLKSFDLCQICSHVSWHISTKRVYKCI